MRSRRERARPLSTHSCPGLQRPKADTSRWVRFSRLRTLGLALIVLSVRSLAAFALVAVLFGCRVTRPPQDNFTLHTDRVGAGPFVTSLSTKLGTTATSRLAEVPGGDSMQMFELQGNGIVVLISSMPNDRCNPNAPKHTTFRGDEFRVDMVYGTLSIFGERHASAEQRQSARKMLMQTAEELDQKLVPFEEC